MNKRSFLKTILAGGSSIIAAPACLGISPHSPHSSNLDLGEILLTTRIRGRLALAEPFILAEEPGSDDFYPYYMNHTILWLERSLKEPGPWVMEFDPEPSFEQDLRRWHSLPEDKWEIKGKTTLSRKATAMRFPGGAIASLKIDNGWLFTIVPPSLQ